MHETSFGNTLKDYISGEEIEETTYEEFRQGLAKLMVEEKGFPKERLKTKEAISYEIDGEKFSRVIDLVAVDDNGRPLMVILFCAGRVGSYERESVSAARLIPGGPAPYALVTDTQDAALMDAKTNECVKTGMAAVPHWDELLEMARGKKMPPLDEKRKAMEERVFHAYCGFLFGTCCSDCQTQGV